MRGRAPWDVPSRAVRDRVVATAISTSPAVRCSALLSRPFLAVDSTFSPGGMGCPMSEHEENLQRVAADAFGWHELRPEQLAAMGYAMQGRDVLAVLPTGAGKSAIYQVPALLIPGPTLVVSPLLALQQDQLDGIDTANAPEAVAVNSLQRRGERRQSWQAIRDGEAEYVFLAPEQLAKEDVVEQLRELGVGLFVVDEAHCVSAWGHDFRPEYRRVGEVIDRLGHPPVIALTATAAPPVRSDIVERLRLRDHGEVIAGFDRPNLRLTVQHHSDERRKRDAVVAHVRTMIAEPGARLGLVYVASRKDAEFFAGELRAAGVRSDHYHAGMKRADRERLHEEFMADRLDVVVATSAFGMGIDKPDVRFVVHTAAPDSLDSYYQHIGRGGRDGEPAEVTLFYRPEDLHLQRFLTARSAPEEALAEVAAALAEAGPMGVGDLADRVTTSAAQRTRALNLLEQADAISTDGHGRWQYLNPELQPAAVVAAAVNVAETHRRLTRSRIEMMRGYAETIGCRRQFLLGYFGEQLPHPCGNCDTCEAGTSRDASAEEHPYSINDAVQHNQWGHGIVMSLEQDRLTVLFDDVGYKTLALAAVERNRLLTPA